MNILAFDTTATAATVAAVQAGNGKITSYSLLTVKNRLTHSETLMPMARQALELMELDCSDIDLFAVSVGPGSFTGVRIGVATVKGLAYNGAMCAGVSTLDALAENLRGVEGTICPVMDARRNCFYNALFRDGKRLTPDRCITAEELEKELAGSGGKVTLCGDGAELFSSVFSIQTTVASPAALYQNALSVAATALRADEPGASPYTVFTKAAALSPVYLRKPQAEREYEERMKEREHS